MYMKYWYIFQYHTWLCDAGRKRTNLHNLSIPALFKPWTSCTQTEKHTGSAIGWWVLKKMVWIVVCKEHILRTLNKWQHEFRIVLKCLCYHYQSLSLGNTQLNWVFLRMLLQVKLHTFILWGKLCKSWLTKLYSLMIGNIYWTVYLLSFVS